MALALVHDGGVQPLAQFGGKLNDLVLAVDGDGLARGVEDDLAVVTLIDVSLNFGKQIGFNLSVEKVGELAKKVGAGHGFLPPLFCLK
jgi:hypothetical protein